MRTAKLRRDQEPQVLDEATLAVIDKADTSFREGKGVTIAEARELNRKRNRAWQDVDVLVEKTRRTNTTTGGNAT